MSDSSNIQSIPNMDVHITDDQTVNLSQYADGKALLIFFYPRANTSGCTQEGKDFRDAIEFFEQHSVVILGASRDKIKAQSNFKAKYEFPFELISDPDETLCNMFDVIKEKNMYGKKAFGIERSTFLFDKNGKLIEEWRKVKVKVHVEEVISRIKQM